MSNCDSFFEKPRRFWPREGNLSIRCQSFFHSSGTNSLLKLLFAALTIFGAFSVSADFSLDPAKTIIRCEPQYRVAANEMAKHFKLITGTEIKINPKTEDALDTFVINVGKQPPGKTEKILPEEGRWLFIPEGAYFYGDGPAGTLNAVYIFLEDELGIRWPAGKDIAYRKMNPVVIRHLSGVWHPVLRLREIRTGRNALMVLWSNRMLAGGHDVPRYGHAFPNWWNRFGKTHPEYFALNEGRRFPIAPDGSRKDDITISNSKYPMMVALCVSNDDVVKQIIRDWDKKSDSINICENDAPANHSCHCDKCIALDPKHSQNLDNNMGADRYIHFANKVIAEAQKTHPGVKVTMYAYNASEQPPVNVKLSPDILLGIVPVDFRFPVLKDYVARWKAAGMKEFFYRPNRHWYYSPMGFPLGNDKHCFEVFQLMYKSGAIAFDYDAPSKFDVFRWHNDYILFHAMAHPEFSFEHWEKHYGEAYGEACDDVVEYFRCWRKVWDERVYPKLNELANPKKNPYFSLIFFRYGRLGKFYTPDDFKTSGIFLENALRKNLSQDERRRVEEIKVFHDHAALMLNAVQTKSAEAVLSVKKFRKEHGMPAIMQYEEDLDDICGIKKLNDMSQFDSPIVDTPLFWHFRMDNSCEGEKKKWFASRDFSKWDGFMPTDSPWENPARHYPHPSPELRRQTADYDGVAWYACEVNIPADWKGKRDILVYFGAVDEAADVWLNSKKVGSHPFVKPKDWETPFTMDITKLIDWSVKTQYLAVKVTDNQGAGGIWKRVYIVSKKNK